MIMTMKTTKTMMGLIFHEMKWNNANSTPVDKELKVHKVFLLPPLFSIFTEHKVFMRVGYYYIRIFMLQGCIIMLNFCSLRYKQFKNSVLLLITF